MLQRLKDFREDKYFTKENGRNLNVAQTTYS